MVKWLLEVAQTKKKTLVRESKSRGKLQKNPIIELSVDILDPEIIIKKEEVVISIIKTTNKIYKPELYHKIIDDSVHGCD